MIDNNKNITHLWSKLCPNLGILQGNLKVMFT